MSRNTILLVLKDKSETDSLSGGLKAAGFEIQSAADGAEALEKAIVEGPSLIISDTELPSLDGERLFRIVRGNLSTSRIPFIIVTDKVLELKGFMSGLDIFLTRPFDPEEVLLIASRALMRKESPAAEGKVINGDLMHMPLADILQFLNMNRKEGELRVSSKDLSATVYIKNGEVYNATLESIEREKALFRLLEWRSGYFEFTPALVTSPKKIRPGTSHLIMEGVRQMDEMRRRRAEFPDKKSLLKAKAAATSLPKGLQPLVYEIIQNVRTHPRVEDLVDRCTHPDYEVYAMLMSMISRSIIEVEKAPLPLYHGLLGEDDGINLMERLRERFAWGLQQEASRIMLLSETSRLVDSFVAACASIPAFARRHMAFFSEASIGEEFGEVASLRLDGGVDLVVFSVPAVRNMGPLIASFSLNAAGMILLYGGPDSREVLKTREGLMERKRLPSVHVVAGEAAKWTPEEMKKAAGLKADEPVFPLLPGGKTDAAGVFKALFSSILREAP